MILALGDIAGALGVRALLPAADVTGFSIDSRAVQPGDLFFALPGQRHDGHDYVKDAFRKGAVAAVVEKEVEAPGPLLRAPNTLQALQDLAMWARRRWSGVVVGVTGSAGKTTTKEAIAAVLSTQMRVGKTTGNLNNHLGVPLSILRLPDQAQVAVLEIGMNHPGEIRQLAEIAGPSVGVVTNVGRAHVEFFSSEEEVALAKRELIESLPRDGVAVLNADDPRVVRFREVYPGKPVTFGFSQPADVRVEQVQNSPERVRFLVKDCGWFESSLIGRHNVMNLLAAIAVGRVFGIPTEKMQDAVRSVCPGHMRGMRFQHRGITIVDDCYNSNPDAVRLMLEALGELPARRRLAVLGEMLELGRHSESLHREVGRTSVACGIDILIGVRGAARYMVEEAVHCGMPETSTFFFETPEEAGDCARKLAEEGDAILFKGSRGTQMERALERFLA
jgi:UDP-N-acetylmuramoyl-tripeptide--D-alanyl-D-alanine ligase